MFIKNRKIYLVSLCVSCAGTALFWLNEYVFKIDFLDYITEPLYFCAIAAGIICGSIGAFWSIIRWAFGISTRFSVSFVGFFCALAAALMLGAVGLAAFLGFPGAFALLAWFWHRDELY